MNQPLTDQQIELLSSYRDQEGTVPEMQAAELLLASSPEARAWLEEVEGLARLQERAAHAAAARAGVLEGVTGSGIALLARHRSSLLRGIVSKGFLGVAIVGLLGVSFVFFGDSESAEPGIVAQSITDEESRPENLLIEGVEILGVVGEELLFLPIPSRPDPTPELASLPGGSNLRAGNEVSSSSSPVKDPRETEGTQDSTVRPATPLQLSITLHHSSADVIIGDDQWSDTLRVRNAPDQIVSLSTRISSLTDSLNADVARIASDTARPSRVRAGLILIRQMEYEKEVARQLDALREMIERRDRQIEHPDGLEGASLVDPAAAGVS